MRKNNISLVENNITQRKQGFPLAVYTWGGGGDLLPHMGVQVQGDKSLMGGLIKGDIDLTEGTLNFDRSYHKLKVLLLLICNYMM